MDGGLKLGCPVCGRTKGFVANVELSNCIVCYSCFVKPLPEDAMVGSKEWNDRARELEEMAKKELRKLARRSWK